MTDRTPHIRVTTGTPHSLKEFMDMVASQAFWICMGYLAIGIISELTRMKGESVTDGHLSGSLGIGDLGAWIQRRADSLPLTAMSLLGFTESYLSESAIGFLASPFWNRVLLSSITAALIYVETLVFGFAFSLFFLGCERLYRKIKGEGQEQPASPQNGEAR